MSDGIAPSKSTRVESEIGVARDLVDHALRDLSHAPADRQHRIPWNAATDARRALDELAGTSVLADDYFERHRKARSRVEGLLAELQQQLGEGGWTRRLTAVLELLGRQRESAMTERLALAGSLRDAAPGSERSDRPSLRASLGVPSLRPLGVADWTPMVARLVGSATGGGTNRDDGEQGRAETDDQLQAMARACLLMIGNLWRARTVQGATPWHQGIASFEQMLLDNLDGFFGFGGVGLFGRQPAAAAGGASTMPGGLANRCDLVELLARYGTESRSDPGRAFALSFVLGCIEGDEPVRLAVMGLAKTHPQTLSAHVDALSLAPSPSIQPAMEQLCQEQDPALIQLGLNVLHHRREGGFGTIAPLLSHPHIGIRRAAARALGVLGPRRAAVAIVEPQLDEELDDEAAGAMAETLLRRDHPRGLSYVRTRLNEEAQCRFSVSRRGRWSMVRLLALAGDGTDLELLCSLMHSPDEVALIGWFGHAGTVEALLEILNEPEPPSLLGALGDSRPQAAARALQRITGAMDPEASSGAHGRADAVPTEPERWRTWWSEHRSDFSHRVKYRHGKPYRADCTLDELSRPGVPADSRVLAELELALVAGTSAGPYVGQWVARQADTMALARRLLQTATSTTSVPRHAPGEWLTQRLGKRHELSPAPR